MSPSASDSLVNALMCLGCGGTTWLNRLASASTLTCGRCGAVCTMRDGVLHVDSPLAPETRREQASIAGTEMNPLLGGWGEGIDLDGDADADLPRAYLSLPYGDGSFRFDQPGYFANVRRFAAEFDFVSTQVQRHVPAGRLLDIGADGTWSTARLAAMGHSCIALDISDHLRLARLYHKVHPPYALVKADMHAPVFRDGVFDAVTAFNVLHHSSHLRALVANLARTLRPGGVLGIVEPYIQGAEQEAVFGVAQSLEGVNEHVHALDHWCSVFSESGLELDAYAISDAFNAVWVKPAGGRVPHVPPGDLFGPSFYKASLSIAPHPATTARGETLTLSVSVANDGPAAWASRGPQPVQLSYHVARVTEHGSEMLVFDNPRTTLPGFLVAGSRWTTDIHVDLPGPGTYEIECDLVHETRAWFHDRGGRTARTRIQVD